MVVHELPTPTNCFGTKVNNAADNTDLGDEEAALEPVDPEKEKYLQMVEEEILDRITDGTDDDLTVNETLSEALEEAIEEVTSPTFREYLSPPVLRHQGWPECL